jgi:transposase
MAYDIRFRKRAIAFIDEGHTYAELYECFKIYPATLADWRRLLSETGSLEPRKASTRRPRKISPEKLVHAIAEKPDAYLRELAEQFNCSISAIHKRLAKDKITYKKRPLPMPKARRKSILSASCCHSG